jgi:hypothetical protein
MTQRPLRLFALLCTLLCALPMPLRAANADAETRQLLEWSGALALLTQAQPLAAQLLAHEQTAGARVPAARQRELLRRFEAATLQQALVTEIAAQLPEATRRAALAALQQPLPKRVRFFERALTQPNSAREWQRWRETGQEVTAARQALLRAIDTAARDSRLTAQLQTAVESSLRAALGVAPIEPVAEALAERERHLQPLTEQYLQYAYRYLRDDELRQYEQQLRQPALQQLFDHIEKGLTAIISGAR